jgi:hypothetical protein
LVVAPNIIGADLALKHGAVVDKEGKIIFVYQSPDGMNSTFESLYQRAKSAALAVPENSIVAVDFDRTCTSWGKNPKVGTLLVILNWSFAVIVRELRNCQVQFVSPSSIRSCLGLSPQTSKRDVHKQTAHLLPENLRGTKFHKDADVRGDIKDAWLLATTYNCTRLK